MLNPEARAWFGSQYKALLDQGIEGFWNDMNEPAKMCIRDSSYAMEPQDVLYGLGENVRGINKRGWVYESKCSDDGNHTCLLYTSNNDLVVFSRHDFPS